MIKTIVTNNNIEGFIVTNETAKADNASIPTCSTIGLGNFDGFHLGHVFLVSYLIRIAKSLKTSSLLYTFDAHPQNVINDNRRIKLLTDNYQKCRIAERMGIDRLFFDKFDIAFSKMTPEEFVQDILIKKLMAKCVVSGFNYRFGRNGAGTSETLKTLAAKYGLKVFVIEPYMVDGVIVSSTLIRKYVSEGYVREASYLLGRLFSIRGKVVNGLRIGRGIGIPTANVIPDSDMLIPKEGVYVSSVKTQDGCVSRGVTSIGNNPTIGVNKQIIVETHIFNCNLDLYGQEIEVFFHTRIRDEFKFDTIKKLKTRIQNDISEAKDYFI